jgi:hypothetical protein
MMTTALERRFICPGEPMIMDSAGIAFVKPGDDLIRYYLALRSLFRDTVSLFLLFSVFGGISDEIS